MKPTIVIKLGCVMADRRMSLNELSERVGVTNVNLSRLKNGKVRAVRLETLALVCQALNCQPGDVLEYTLCPEEDDILLDDSVQDDD